MYYLQEYSHRVRPHSSKYPSAYDIVHEGHTLHYNVVCGYAVNFASGLVPGVRTNKSAAQCINSSGGGAGDTTAAAATTCVADQITASSFRLRTNGSSRCWANGSQIRWIALAM